MFISMVIEGDYKGREVKIDWGAKAYINAKGRNKVFLNSSTVKEYDIIEVNDKKSFSSGVARGIVGGAMFGGVGALAGVNSAKNIMSAKIKIRFKDGKCSLLNVDKNTYDCIINKCFNLESDAPASCLSAFCTNCGAKLTDGVKFCPSCGFKISESATETSSQIIKNIPEKKSKNIRKSPSEISRQASQELLDAVKKIKNDFANNYGRKMYSSKQIKKFFAIAVAIAAVITLVLEIALYSPEDGIVVSIMMFIFCTTVLSIPLVIGTLLICLPSIRYNRKNRGDDE